jgi:hypothetical protein
MTPQMEHAATFEALTLKGSRQLGPVGRAAVSNVPPEVLEGVPPGRIPGENEEPVRVGLNRGWQHPDSCFQPWEVERNQFDAA